MACAKITAEVIKAHLQCNYKSSLLAAGIHGDKSEYEIALDDLREEIRQKAEAKIHGSTHFFASPNERSALDRLLQGAAFIQGFRFEDEHFAIRFDGLQRVDGKSNLGDFHYQPVLFSGRRNVNTTDRRFLELMAVILGRMQGTLPAAGIVYHGCDCIASNVRLSAGTKRAEETLRELGAIATGSVNPKLALNAHCPACEFQQTCHSQAVASDNLTLLRGLRNKQIRALQRRGITTLMQLAHTFRPRRRGRRESPRSNKRYHALQAMAIRDKRIYVLGSPEVPETNVRIYLDVESNPELGFVYLIGMTICDGKHERHQSFWADEKAQELEMFESFLGSISQYERFIIYCYGNYERAFIKRLQRHTVNKPTTDLVLGRIVNVLSLIHSHFYFPTYSNGLKEIAKSMGYAWSQDGASGLQSIAWRIRWERTRDEGLKSKLLQYNREDCTALRLVTEFLAAACQQSADRSDTTAEVSDPAVIHVAELDRQTASPKWGKVKFADPTLAYVNNCAYFDYQRHRVFIRTSKSLKKNLRRRGTHVNRTLRVNRRVKMIPGSCPKCGNEDISIAKNQAGIAGVTKRVKRSLDLAIASTGVRRRVVEYRAPLCACSGCGSTFVHPDYDRLARHGHGLMSWAMNGHVGHRLSAVTLQAMFRETFGLGVTDSEIHEMKHRMALYYYDTYRRLLATITTGNVLHVDETEVKLRTGNGYVWVFASIEEVVFIYRPTRSGEFLQDVLKSFRGVLISDFFAAYDSIDCPQQKCLIHLIRDINEELLAQPYDNELQSITQAFGSLLRSMVDTCDRHGLKRLALERHSLPVAKFFDKLRGESLASEAARSLQDRLLRNERKLFTFLHYDSVPWNNNNAENAIKQFAYYRANTVGVMKEEGLGDYLILLSLCQTCRYKGVSFLSFLASGIKDIDEFSQNKRARDGRREIELYPEGYTPKHLVSAQLASKRRVSGSSS